MIYISSTAAMSPQQYSHDFLVRLTAPALQDIVFQHLYTVQDRAVLEDLPLRFEGQCAGSTEWQAQVGRIAVSLAWDWAETADGSLRTVEAVMPRSNLRLIDAHGYDLPDSDGAPLLWQRIHAIAWKPQVAAALHGASGRPH